VLEGFLEVEEGFGRVGAGKPKLSPNLSPPSRFAHLVARSGVETWVVLRDEPLANEGRMAAGKEAIPCGKEGNGANTAVFLGNQDDHGGVSPWVWKIKPDEVEKEPLPGGE
jgi:hypothetical protein